jgi:hypothetical protein
MWARWGSNPRPIDYESTTPERCAHLRKRSSALNETRTIICSLTMAFEALSEVHEQSERVAYLRECNAADIALGPDDPRHRDGADVLALRCRVLVEAVVVVGCDGDFGGVAADRSGERNDLYDAGGAREDALCCHRDRGAGETRL